MVITLKLKLINYSALVGMVGESINTGPDYWNGGLILFNALYLASYTYLICAHTLVLVVLYVQIDE